jgi:hypothetical protein
MAANNTSVRPQADGPDRQPVDNLLLREVIHSRNADVGEMSAWRRRLPSCASNSP